MTQKTAVEDSGNISSVFYSSHSWLPSLEVEKTANSLWSCLIRALPGVNPRATFSYDVNPDFYLNGAILRKHRVRLLLRYISCAKCLEVRLKIVSSGTCGV